MIGDILQPTHLIFILVVALLVLGPKRLPEVGRSLGRGIRDFKGALTSDDDDRADAVPSQTTAQSTQPAPAPAIHEPIHEPAPAPAVHEPVREPAPVPAVHEPVREPAPAPAPVDGPGHQPAPAPVAGPEPEPVHEPAPEPVEHTG